jgi:hypothetical protein
LEHWLLRSAIVRLHISATTSRLLLESFIKKQQLYSTSNIPLLIIQMGSITEKLGFTTPEPANWVPRRAYLRPEKA